MSGTIGILNVGAGDTKLVFDPTNPAEMIRAARIVKDMLRRGYALLVDSGQTDSSGRPIYMRAKDFDETKFEYIIADFDPTAPGGDIEPTAETTRESAGETQLAPLKRRGRPPKRVAASEVNVVAVSRSAGG